MEQLLSFVLEHWAFATAWGFFYVFGVIMKRTLFSSERAETQHWVRFVRRWLPLPLHPVVAGVALGLVPGVPLPEGVAQYALGGVFYYAGAGVLSIVWHDIYREWRKYEGSPELESESPGLSLSAEDLRSGPPPADRGT